MLENLSGFLAAGGEVHVRRGWSAVVAEQVSCGVKCAAAQCININDPTTTVAFGAAGLKTPAAGENTPPPTSIHTHLIATWDKHV